MAWFAVRSRRRLTSGSVAAVLPRSAWAAWLRGTVGASALSILVSMAWADQEASNVPHVTASDAGRCYAKSIPADLYGGEGTTTVYRVESGPDVRLHTFEWFTQQLYIECNVAPADGAVGVSVVRFGAWARGREARSDELAIAFYFDGRLRKRYSTLDIAGTPENVSTSVSHYTVFEAVDAYRSTGAGNRFEFVVQTTDGRTLHFDPATGERLPPSHRKSRPPRNRG